MIRVIGDTTSGYNLEQAKALGIEFIPQLVIFGDKTYRDDTEMDSAMFAKKLAESPELPKTAAPPPALYTPIYKDMQEKGDSGIVICPSTDLSGTVRSATTALQDFPDLDVRIIDTRSIGSSMATLLKRRPYRRRVQTHRRPAADQTHPDPGQRTRGSLRKTADQEKGSRPDH